MLQLSEKHKVFHLTRLPEGLEIQVGNQRIVNNFRVSDDRTKVEII